MPQEITRPLVLIADPDIECVVLMARQLEWAGYSTIATGDGAEAHRLVDERRPDAVLVEAKLAGMDGYALVQRIRAEEHHRLLPIVMISSRAGKLDRDFAFTAGADDYVRKPFACSHIIARIATLVPAPAPPALPLAYRRLRPRRPVAQPALALR
jgi:CheY-like chemotaxis protein